MPNTCRGLGATRRRSAVITMDPVTLVAAVHQATHTVVNRVAVPVTTVAIACGGELVPMVTCWRRDSATPVGCPLKRYLARSTSAFSTE